MSSTGAVPLMLLLLPAFAAAYVRYSDAYIGTPVACSEEEKFCFRYNLLYNAKYGKCARMFSHCSVIGEELVVDKEHLTGPEPKLKAKCGSARCPRHLESYFWPRGECLEPAAADLQCAGSSRTLNVFGEWECWCADGTNATNTTSGSPCPSPAARPQPPDAGRCVVPSLFEPYARSDEPAAAWPCSEQEFHCFSGSQVLFQGQCVTPLERGPCAEGEWVVLAPGPPLQAVCAPRRCPNESHVWIDTPEVTHEPQCQPKDNAAKLLCQDREELLINAFGYGKCDEKENSSPFDLPNVRENGMCRVRTSNSRPFPVPPASIDQQSVSDAAAATPPVPKQPSTVPSVSALPQVVGSPQTSTLPVVALSPEISPPSPIAVNSETSTPSPVALSPEVSTPLPIAIIPESSTSFPVGVRSEAPALSPVAISPETSTPFPIAINPEVSTPLSIAIIPETSTPFPITINPEVSGSTEVAQQVLIDPQPCVVPPCSISSAVTQAPSTPQVSSPEIVAVPSVIGNVEISSPPEQKTTIGQPAQVNQEQTIVGQVDSSPPVAAPVDFSISSQLSGAIIHTPSMELVAPDVFTREQQLAGGENAVSTAINESVGPATLQNQLNSETVTPTQALGNLGGLSPSDQGISALGNSDVAQQQLVEQPQLGHTTVAPVSELVADSVIQTLPSISADPNLSAGTKQNGLLADETKPLQLPQTLIAPQVLEQGQSHIGGSVQLQQASISAIPVLSTNVSPVISAHPGNVIVPLFPPHVNGDVPQGPVQIIQGEPSVGTLGSTNTLPVVSVQPSNGNIPLGSFQPGQNNLSPALVQRTPEHAPIDPVQAGRGDVVVDYVLLGQSPVQVPVPVNSV